MWQNRSPNNKLEPLVCLVGWVVVLAIIWFALLPFLGRQPSIASYIQRNERLGIDPSAKFYTEVPAAPELIERMQNRLGRLSPDREKDRHNSGLEAGDRFTEGLLRSDL
jgi:hypothetical protein